MYQLVKNSFLVVRLALVYAMGLKLCMVSLFIYNKRLVIIKSQVHKGYIQRWVYHTPLGLYVSFRGLVPIGSPTTWRLEITIRILARIISLQSPSE